MPDLASPDVEVWQFLESSARDVLARYGYCEVRTPFLEKVETFTRSIGDETDIVQKEMYAFVDRGDRHIALRPEGTAGVMRYVAGQGQEAADARLYYIGPMFRAENVQAGRYRQFSQLGVEMIGPPNPMADVEVMDLQRSLLQAWGIEGASFEINTRGMPEDMDAVRTGLKQQLEIRIGELCGDCQRRFESNILRVLDCKVPSCKAIVNELPPMTDFMSEASRDYLVEVEKGLKQLNLDCRINPLLVRGLDYYANTVWEITSGALGAQNALAGGGRYRIGLGSKNIEGAGFGIGLNRIFMVLAEQFPDLRERFARPMVMVIGQNEEIFRQNMILVQRLRDQGIPAVMELTVRSMKAQFKAANRKAVSHVIVRGEAEVDAGTCQLKNMADGNQQEIGIDSLASHLLAELNLK
jgi:histidyl-tRNA synthetase